jgi:hypothetical protein
VQMHASPHPSSVTESALFQRAQEVSALGLSVDAQLLAEAAFRLKGLWACRHSGRRPATPPSDNELILPRKLRAHGGFERALMQRAASEIDTLEKAIWRLSAAPSPAIQLSSRMRQYILDGVHPGCEASLLGLANRGIIQEPRWGASLTDLGLSYVWTQMERRLDVHLTSRQRGDQLVILSEQIAGDLLSEASPLKTQRFRDRTNIVDTHLGDRPIGVLHPFLAWKIRLHAPIQAARTTARILPIEQALAA